MGEGDDCRGGVDAGVRCWVCDDEEDVGSEGDV